MRVTPCNLREYYGRERTTVIFRPLKHHIVYYLQTGDCPTSIIIYTHTGTIASNHVETYNLQTEDMHAYISSHALAELIHYLYK